MLWIAIDQAKRTQGVDYMTPLLSVGIWIAALGCIVLAVYLNVRDARRAKALDVDLKTSREQLAGYCRTTESTERMLREDLAKNVKAREEERQRAVRAETKAKELQAEINERVREIRGLKDAYSGKPDPSGGLFSSSMVETDNSGLLKRLNFASETASSAGDSLSEALLKQAKKDER